ncbi:hypothetical protein [Helicobacter apodemus]|uniref:Uncharacterized protein n=1 Tax=Helicobacter apodemus TaxID=135569 RepID=A0A2U8FF39_9HELI|nr:hypothetical protein [Helicobacter apodemus]AWI34862.1 hypothetical protein CDV25_08870 [Helicobacter apodemus]
MFEIFLVALQILFIALKLTGKINWSWFLVLIPLIIYLVFYLFLFTLMGGFLIGLGISLSSIM